MPRDRTTELDVEDCLSTLSASDCDWAVCTVEGAAEVWRDQRRKGASALDCPVDGDRLSNDGWLLLCPETVFEDDMASTVLQGLVVAR